MQKNSRTKGKHNRYGLFAKTLSIVLACATLFTFSIPLNAFATEPALPGGQQADVAGEAAETGIVPAEADAQFEEGAQAEEGAGDIIVAEDQTPDEAVVRFVFESTESSDPDVVKDAIHAACQIDGLGGVIAEASAAGVVWPTTDPNEAYTLLTEKIRTLAELEARYNAIRGADYWADNAEKKSALETQFRALERMASDYAGALAAYVGAPDDTAAQEAFAQMAFEFEAAFAEDDTDAISWLEIAQSLLMDAAVLEQGAVTVGISATVPEGSAYDPVVIEKTGRGAVTFEYSADQADWSLAKPAQAGNYFVRGQLAAADAYTAATSEPVAFTVEAAMMALGAVMALADDALPAGTPATLGGQTVNGVKEPLYVGIFETGNQDVRVYSAGSYGSNLGTSDGKNSASHQQWYNPSDNGFVVYIQDSAGTKLYASNIYVKGSATTMGVAKVYQDSSYQARQVFTQAHGSGTFTLEITYTLMPGGRQLSMSARLANNTGRDLTTCRVLFGGDTYFAGSDSGYTYYNALNNMVYVYKDANYGIMSISGSAATPFDQYYSGHYSTGLSQIKAGALGNTATEKNQDASLYIGWTRSIANGSEFTVSAGTSWTEAGALQVIAPAGKSAPPGLPNYPTDVNYEYQVMNLSSAAMTATLSVASSNGWSASVVGSTSVSIPANGKVIVPVVVSIPSTATNGMQDILTLTATSASKNYTGKATTTVDTTLPALSLEKVSQTPTELQIRVNFVNLTGAHSVKATLLKMDGTSAGVAAQTRTISSGDIFTFNISGLTMNTQYMVEADGRPDAPYPARQAFTVSSMPKVTFDANGGSTASPADKYVTTNEKYGSLASTARTGHTFAGWFTAKTSGTQVTADTVVSATTAHTLYAQWTANKYTVSFNANGGDAPSKASMEATFGSTYGALATVSRAGYAFSGWYTEQSAGTKVETTTVVAAESDHTLYARWTANKYTVSFNANGGTASTTSMEATFGSAYGALATADRAGYAFAGWYTEQGVGTKVEAATTVATVGNHTLYAHWTANGYTASFNLNYTGAPANPADKAVTFDAAYGDLPTAPARTGYDFNGWFSLSGGGNEITAATIVSKPDNHTLFAQWTAKTVTVAFNANGSGNAPSMASKSVTFDGNYAALATITRTGYDFAGWFDAATGGNEVTTATKVANASDHALFAQWTAKGYTVAFDSNGGNTPSMANKPVTFDAEYGSLATVSRVGYTFTGWYTAKTSGALVVADTHVETAGNHTLYARWTANSYNVAFDENGGTTPSPAGKNVTFDSAYGALADTTREGYAFAGWFTEANGGTEVTASTIVKTADGHALYAHWTAKTYAVAFSKNGGDTVSPSGKDVTFDGTYGALATATRTGYDFVGWFTAENGGQQVTADTVVKTAAAHTLYAQWTANSYNVVFDANGGNTPNPTDKNVVFDQKYGELAQTTRTGYTFAGWFTAENGGTEVTADTILKTAAAHTLHARWTANSYTVSFNGNGGTAPAPGSKSVAFDAKYGELAQTTRTGYTFAGWFTAADGGTEVTAATDMTTAAAHTLHAHWTANSYKVSFDAGSGTAPAPGSKNVAFDQKYGELAQTARTGYTFAGWFTTANGGTEVTADTDMTTAAAHTLHAHWTANAYKVSFEANGGTAASPAEKNVTFDAKYGELATTARTGYTFAGWFTEANGGTEVTAATDMTTAAAHVLHAHWTPNKYTVNFDGNNGSNPSPAGKEVTFDAKYGELATTARTGYTFSGWWTAKTGGEQVTADTAVKTAATHTLFARWTANKYDVTFAANGGNTPNPTGKNVTFDEKYGDLAKVTRAGYTFSGWFTTAAAGSEVTKDSIVGNADAHTLWAHWTANEQSVRYYANFTGAAQTPWEDNGGSPKYTTDQSVTVKAYTETALEAHAGYTFRGWSLTEDGNVDYAAGSQLAMPATGSDLYALWTVNDYQVDFDGNGGNVPAPGYKNVTFDAKYGALEAAVRTGYTFDGWFTAANGGEQVTANTVVKTANDHVLHARWTANDYTVSFDAGGGTNASPDDKTVTFDKKYGSLAQTARTGYTFAGWFTAANGGTEVTSETVMKTAEAHTLHARWTANDYAVSFDADGGTDAVPAGKTVTFDKKYGDLAQTTRTGYTFAGWFTAANGGTEVTAGTVVKTADAHTLHARWTANDYTVSFDAHGGTSADPADKSVTFDEKYGNLAATARTGYTFDGWFTAANGGDEVTKNTVLKTASAHILHAQWTANDYKVSFDANGGVNAIPSNKYVVFDQVYGTLADTAREGYIFDGWFTAKNGGDKVMANTVLKNANAHTLYAHWTALSNISVSFDSAGGTSASPANKTVTFDAAYGTLADTAREGYTFLGWFTAAEGGSAVAQETIVKNAAAHTLVARWKANTYEASFDAKGGSAPNPASKTVTFDAKYGDLAKTARTGYTFAGWFLGASEVTKDAIMRTAGAHTLDAQWTANKYEVSFNANGGGTPSAESKEVTFDSAYGDLATISRTGYSFAGWYTEKTGGSKITAASTVSVAGSHTLYARWTANAYTLSFDAHGGNTPIPASKRVTFDAAYGELATAVRTGYTFIGWFTEADGGTQVKAETKVAKTNDHKVYARWTANTYTITFNANAGTNPETTKTATFDAAYGTLPAVSFKGYLFDGWFTAKTGGSQVTATMAMNTAGDHTLYAHWTATNDNVLCFNTNGGANVTPASWNDLVYDRTLAAQGKALPTAGNGAPTREGYDFMGWSTQSGAGNTADFTNAWSVNWAGAATVYAVWQGHLVTVEFLNNYTAADDTHYATGENSNSGKRYGDKLAPFLAPTRAGYTFRGWYTTNAGGTQWDFANATVSTEPTLKLYAMWTENDGYSVVYDLNGGTSAAPAPKSNVKWTQKDLIPQQPTRKGYDFAGWNVVSGGKGIDVQNSASFGSLAANDKTTAITLRAQWTAKRVTLKFDANGGVAGARSVTSKKVVFDGTVGSLPTPGNGAPVWETESCSFLGWATSPDAKAPNYTAGDMVDFDPEKTVYAVWRDMSESGDNSGSGSSGNGGQGDSTQNQPAADGASGIGISVGSLEGYAGETIEAPTADAPEDIETLLAPEAAAPQTQLEQMPEEPVFANIEKVVSPTTAPEKTGTGLLNLIAAMAIAGFLFLLAAWKRRRKEEEEEAENEI